ncbi:MAG TPA: nitrilase-related carbon-nitrogen hydrolase [Bacteroidales bacterium]|nr:nitrilase-related carbon-nitrogen hydrolase [Bacteroidales bacterium]HPS16781.1 nitrilase-related carbon-nitrogen hydrolase [Bacteroidales bacterium]
MQDLNVAIVQTDLVWENADANLEQIGKKLDEIKNPVDLIVLPEMFNTAFSMKPLVCAEMPEGRSFQWMKEKAKEKNCVLTGSMLINDGGKFFNRLFWMMPNGTYQCYDKKHLFRFSGENNVFSAGRKKITPSLNGWNIRPLICYDLRFPIWSMNTFSNGKFEYDCIVYVANWAESRKHPWISLLIARAIENQVYVIAVNRVGIDGKGTTFSGDSMIIDPKGNIIKQIPSHKETIEIATLLYSELQSCREHFTVALDWDRFKVEDM